MMFGPALPLLLLAIPAVIAIGVVLAGLVGMLFGSREATTLPRAVARPAPARVPTSVPVAVEDEATVVFARGAFAR
jgi:hypothetical protein